MTYKLAVLYFLPATQCRMAIYIKCDPIKFKVT